MNQRWYIQAPSRTGGWQYWQPQADGWTVDPRMAASWETREQAEALLRYLRRGAAVVALGETAPPIRDFAAVPGNRHRATAQSHESLDDSTGEA